MNGVLKKEDFKIIYVAPMKALASEMTSSFGSKLAPLGVQVKELTGTFLLVSFKIYVFVILNYRFHISYFHKIPGVSESYDYA